jgi:hypothetical protein
MLMKSYIEYVKIQTENKNDFESLSIRDKIVLLIF